MFTLTPAEGIAIGISTSTLSACDNVTVTVTFPLSPTLFGEADSETDGGGGGFVPVVVPFTNAHSPLPAMFLARTRNR